MIHFETGFFPGTHSLLSEVGLLWCKLMIKSGVQRIRTLRNLLPVCLFFKGFFIYILFSLLWNLCHLTWVRLQQLQEQRYPVLQVYAGSFHVSVIHRTLTWTTGSLTGVRAHSYAMHIHTGVGHTDSKPVQHFWLGKTPTNFSCAPDGIEPRVFRSRVRRFTNCVTPVAELWVTCTTKFSSCLVGYATCVKVTLYVVQKNCCTVFFVMLKWQNKYIFVWML